MNATVVFVVLLALLPVGAWAINAHLRYLVRKDARR